jgi:SpoIID/LytB domain protein
LLPVQAAAFNTVPEKTLQVVSECTQTEIAPQSEFVRVGIGDSAFKNYDYTEITIFGNNKVNVYDNAVLVDTYPAYKPIKIKLENENLFVYGNEQPEQIDGALVITCTEGLLGVQGLKRAGKQALYRGTFEIVRKGDKFNLVNVLPVEDYLKGVVPNEMPVSFGLEALKAQSVAARNYVLAPRSRCGNYQVVDSVASQVYFGANTEQPLSNQAVEQTEGVLALYHRDIILALYSSTAGGYTESYANAFLNEGKPYLIAVPDIILQTPLNTEEAASQYYKSRPDSYDMRSPYFRWTREWGVSELNDLFKDEFVEFKVKRRGESGKIIELEIVTKNGSQTVRKELAIRRLLTKDGKALPSANVVFENIYDEDANLTGVKAYGGGFGHGVGMSQYGAGFMGSEMKYSYDKILQHYYTGIALGTKPVIISSDVTQNSAAQYFYTYEPDARIIVDNKFNVSKCCVVINCREECFKLPAGHFGKRITEIDISPYIEKGRNSITFMYPPDEGDKKTLRLYVELAGMQ